MKFLPKFCIILLFVILPIAAYLTPPLYAQQNMSVSMVIPARADDYQIAISKVTPDTQFPHNSIITFSITYGTFLPSTSTFTVQAQWYPGVLRYPGSPTVEVFSYIYGSASDGYNNTPAVIDLQNKTISWTFTDFPGNTQDQTVTFQLLTNAHYAGNIIADVPVKARISGPGVTTDDSTVTIPYLYAPPPGPPTPTPTIDPKTLPTPTPNLTPGPTAIQTITPTPSPPTSVQFTSLFLKTVISNEAAITFQTNTPTTSILRFGKNAANLSEIIQSLDYTNYQTIQLPHLSPNTQYYFQLTTRDKAGKTNSSDIFTFKTARVSDAPQVDFSSIIISSDNKIFTTHGDTIVPNTAPVFLLPQNTAYDIQFSFDKTKVITSAQIVTRNKFVLGEKTAVEKTEPPLTSIIADMVEIRKGVFLAKLNSPPKNGIYELYTRLTDTNGNIVEQKVGELIASPKMQITDTQNSPIEHARVLLFVSNTTPDLFTLIGNHAIENPVFSDFHGEVKTILPPGRYKARVSALGYSTEEVTFTIGQSVNDGYPHIQLEKQPVSLLSTIGYGKDNLTDMMNTFFATMQSFAASSRVFDYTTMTLLWLFVTISFLAFSEKTHTHPKAGISQLGYMLHRLFSRSAKEKYVIGTVLDKKLHTPLSKANVFVIDNNSRNVLFETVTNKKGSFVLKNPFRDYHLMSVKKGYEAAILYPQGSDLLYIMMHANTKHQPVVSLLWSTYRRILTMCFETVLLFSFILELFLTGVFGLEKTLPFILFSLINVLLWIYYLSLKHHKDI